MASQSLRHQEQFLSLLPADKTGIGNSLLWSQFQTAWQAQGTTVTEADFHTARDALVNTGLATISKRKIAAWSLDTDDGRSLLPHQLLCPMVGKEENQWTLKKNIRAELDDRLLNHFADAVPLADKVGQNRAVAVKIVDDRGIESLKVMRLDMAATGGA